MTIYIIHLARRICRSYLHLPEGLARLVSLSAGVDCVLPV